MRIQQSRLNQAPRLINSRQGVAQQVVLKYWARFPRIRMSQHITWDPKFKVINIELWHKKSWKRCLKYPTIRSTVNFSLVAYLKIFLLKSLEITSRDLVKWKTVSYSKTRELTSHEVLVSLLSKISVTLTKFWSYMINTRYNKNGLKWSHPSQLIRWKKNWNNFSYWNLAMFLTFLCANLKNKKLSKLLILNQVRNRDITGKATLVLLVWVVARKIKFIKLQIVNRATLTHLMKGRPGLRKNS